MKIDSGRVTWTHVRLTNALSMLGKVGWACMFVAIGLEHTKWFGHDASALIGLSALVMFGALVVSYAVWLSRISTAGELEIVGDELFIPRGFGRRRVPVKHVTSAWVIDKRIAGVLYPAVEVEIEKHDIVTAHATDRAQAEAFVAELGYGPSGRRVRVDLAKPTRRLINLPLGVLAYFLAMMVALAIVLPILALTHSAIDQHAGMVLIGPFSLAIYTLLKRLVRVAEVTVGNDGIHAHVGSTRRFIARRDVAAVSSNVRELPLVLRLRDGEMVSITGAGIDPERRLALGRLIEQRLFQAGPAPDKPYAFERGERSIAAWRQELGHAMQDTGYRSNNTSPEDAQAVLASPLATAEQRVGAALALRAAGQADRVRVAADATADPQVRVALEGIAADEDEKVEKALEALKS